MSQADTLIENLRKAKLELSCAKANKDIAEEACYLAQDELSAAKTVYQDALNAIEVAASNNE